MSQVSCVTAIPFLLLLRLLTVRRAGLDTRTRVGVAGCKCSTSGELFSNFNLEMSWWKF